MTGYVGRPPESPNSFVARRLVYEIGISLDQATDLVARLGPHSWTSLVRKARQLRLTQNRFAKDDVAGLKHAVVAAVATGSAEGSVMSEERTDTLPDAVEIFENIGGWLVLVVRDGKPQVTTFDIEAHARSFAAGQAVAIGTRPVNVTTENRSPAWGRAASGVC